MCIVFALTARGLQEPCLCPSQRDDANPTVSVNPAAGSYGTVQNVALNCGDTGGAGCSKIAYTTNGSTPSFSSACVITNGTLYATPITTPDSSVTSIRFQSCDNACNSSNLYTQTYTVDSVLPSITINSVLPGATIQGGVAPAFNWQSNKDGNYTIKIGSDCGSGTLATGTNVSGSAINGVALTTTVSAGAQLPDGNRKINVCVTNLIGNVGTSSSTITVDSVAPTLVVAPIAGTYIPVQTVIATCSDATSGFQKVAYTTNGTTPTMDLSVNITNGNLYTGSLSTPDNTSTTYRFLARDNAGQVSGLSSLTYNIGTPPVVATPVFTPPAGHYNTPQNITLTSTTSGATVYYTTDGSTPTTTSAVYTNPIHIWGVAGKTIKMNAVKAGLSDSNIVSGIYSYPPLRTGDHAFTGSGDDGRGVERSYTGPTQHGTYTSDYTTKDNATGLLWKTCTQGLSGATCVTGTAVTLTWANAESDATNGCTALNSTNGGNGYAGKKNWRVPSVQELSTLVSFIPTKNPTPRIETTVFPATQYGAYWSSTTVALYTAHAWFVEFATAYMTSAPKEASGWPYDYGHAPRLLARCVSGQ